jgi:hypothetical protein
MNYKIILTILLKLAILINSTPIESIFSDSKANINNVANSYSETSNELYSSGPNATLDSEQQQLSFPNYRSLNAEPTATNSLNTNYDMGDYSDGSDLDSSIFGNTGESFFDFANRKTAELKAKNNKLLENSINSCSYSSASADISLSQNSNDLNRKYEIKDPEGLLDNDLSVNSASMSTSCVVGSYKIVNAIGLSEGRLFTIDPNMIGLVISSDSTLRLFSFNSIHKTLKHLRTKTFRRETPMDACADKNRNIYIVFPDQNKIVKYSIIQSHLSKSHGQMSKFSNRSHVAIKELISVKDVDFSPSAVSCYDDMIYVSERPKNLIRVYDKLLRLMRVIYLNDVVISAHKSISINQNARVIMDGNSAVALLNPNFNLMLSTSLNKKKYSIIPDNNKVSVCHFFKSVDCLEDVEVITKTKTKSSIFVADSCDKDIKVFNYSKDEKIKLINKISLMDEPNSIVINSNDYLFEFSARKSKINILDLKECNL